MPQFFMVSSGPITKYYQEPFVLATMDEVYSIIEDFLLEKLDAVLDIVSVYEIPAVSGRATLVWQFVGMEYMDSAVANLEDIGDDLFLNFPQGKLPNHETTVLQELLANDWGPDWDDEYDLDDWIPPSADDTMTRVLDALPFVTVEDVELKVDGFSSHPFSD